MKVAIISDIHGNLEGFEAILAKIKDEEVDNIYNLGDLIGYGPNPKECFDLAMEKKIISIKGNHEYSLVENDISFMNEYAQKGIVYSKNLLMSKDIDEMKKWRFTKKIDNMLLFHGTPIYEEYFRYIIYEKMAQDIFNYNRLVYSNVKISFFGHTHEKNIYFLDERKKIKKGKISYKWLDLSEKRYYLVNPGSVGQPRDGDSFSSGIIYDIDNFRIKWIKAKYDIDFTFDKIKSTGLPIFLGKRLYFGN